MKQPLDLSKWQFKPRTYINNFYQFYVVPPNDKKLYDYFLILEKQFQYDSPQFKIPYKNAEILITEIEYDEHCSCIMCSGIFPS